MAKKRDYKVGDVVKLPSGRIGTVIKPPGSEGMPNHALLDLAGDGQRWIFTSALLPVEKN